MQGLQGGGPVFGSAGDGLVGCNKGSLALGLCDVKSYQPGAGKWESSLVCSGANCVSSWPAGEEGGQCWFHGQAGWPLSPRAEAGSRRFSFTLRDKVYVGMRPVCEAGSESILTCSPVLHLVAFRSACTCHLSQLWTHGPQVQ